jgi:hypothetical protein
MVATKNELRPAQAAAVEVIEAPAEGVQRRQPGVLTERLGLPFNFVTEWTGTRLRRRGGDPRSRSIPAWAPLALVAAGIIVLALAFVIVVGVALALVVFLTVRGSRRATRPVPALPGPAEQTRSLRSRP